MLNLTYVRGTDGIVKFRVNWTNVEATIITKVFLPDLLQSTKFPLLIHRFLYLVQQAHCELILTFSA